MLTKRDLLCSAAMAALAAATAKSTPAIAQNKADWPRLLEAKDIAEAGFIYGLPIVMNYAIMYEYAVDRNSGQFKAPFNEIKNLHHVATPEDTAVITPNSDTPYSVLWLDLRAEPMVISVPAIEKDRYYAVMLIDGIVTFISSHDEKRMKHPKVVELKRRIELFGDDELTRVIPSRQGIVELKLKDGRNLRHHTKAVRGTAQNPMARAEVDEKAYHLLAPILGKARARKLCDAVWTLDRLSNMRKLRPLLRA